MAEVVARFKVEVDWSNNEYAHVHSDVTDELEGLRIRYGVDIAFAEREPQIQFGDGEMRLLAAEGVYGDVVTTEQLREVHLFRVTELVTGLQCFVGRAEFVEEWQASITRGDVLNFKLVGLGNLKDGGTLTYPKGSEFGGSADDALDVITSEDVTDPTEYTTTETVSGTLPTHMNPGPEGSVIGELSNGAIVELAGLTRRQYAAVAVNSSRTEAGAASTRTISVTRTYRNYEDSRVEEDDFSGTSSISGTLPTQMQTLPDGRAIGQLTNGQIVELEGATRRTYGAIGVNTSRSETGQPGNVDVTANKRTRNYENQSRIYLVDETNNFLRAYLHGGTRRSGEDITLISDNWKGASYYDGTFYILDGNSGSNKQVSAYSRSGSADSSKTFNLGSRFTNPTLGGIATTANRHYILTRRNEIMVVDHSGVEQASEDFPLINNNQWTGLTVDGEYFYVIDDRDDQIYRLSLSALPFEIPSSAAGASGIFVTATRIYVVTSSGDKVIVLDHSGTEQTSESFDLGSGNDGPTGIAVTSNRVYVLDGPDDKIYAYSLNGTRQSGDDVALGSVNDPQGLDIHGGRFYVHVKGTSPDQVRVYDSDGTYNSSLSFEASISTGQVEGIGIAVTDDRVIIASSDQRKVFSFEHDGTHVPSEDFVLGGGVGWRGMSEYNGILYCLPNQASPSIVFPIPHAAPPIDFNEPSLPAFPSGSGNLGSFNGVAVTDSLIYVVVGAGFRSERYGAFAFNHDGSRSAGNDLVFEAVSQITFLSGIAIIDEDPAIISTTNTDESNYTVPATVDRLTETTTYNGPVFADDSNIYRVRRVQGREFDSYVAGSTTPAESDDSSDWTDSKTFDSDIHSVDITYSWSAGQIETRTWDNWQAAGYPWSRGEDGQLDIGSSSSNEGAVPALMQSGTRTYFWAGSALHLITNQRLYSLSGLGGQTVALTGLGRLPVNVRIARAGAEIGQYRYLISNIGNQWWNADDLDSTPTLIGSFAAAIRPFAIAYDAETVYIYESNGDYFEATRDRTLLSSHTATVQRSVPVTSGRETETTTFSGRMFFAANRLWKLRRVQGREFTSWIAGSSDEEEGGMWEDSTTYDESIHSITTQYTWSAGSATDRSWDRRDFAGWTVARAANQSLTIGSTPATGGAIPTQLRTSRLIFLAGGGLFFIGNSGGAEQVAGFPGSASLNSRGTVGGDIDGSRSAIYVGRRLYLLNDNGRGITHIESLTDFSDSTDLGDFPSSFTAHALGYDADTIFAYNLTNGNVRTADRLTRTTNTREDGGEADGTLRLRDELDIEFIDETVRGENPFAFLRAMAEGHGVEFDEASSTAVSDDLSGLPQFGPQWDIALADTVYRGWTGQFVVALRDGDIAAFWPQDVDEADRSLALDEVFVVEPFELRLLRRLVINAVRAEGYRVLT